MKYKKVLPIIIICLLIIFVIAFISSNSHEDKVDVNNDINKIESIKNEMNATADTDMFQVETEYDGREILQIKPKIQFDTVLAGILKKDMPKESEIDEILVDAPTGTGVWIPEQSKNLFLELLSNNGINNFYVDDNGYLKISNNSNNEMAKQIEEMINSDFLYIIDMSGKCYMRDDVSGEVVEYPFEDMDPYQLLEPFSNDNTVILVLTTNKKNLLSNDELLDGLLAYAEK